MTTYQITMLAMLALMILFPSTNYAFPSPRPALLKGGAELASNIPDVASAAKVTDTALSAGQNLLDAGTGAKTASQVSDLKGATSELANMRDGLVGPPTVVPEKVRWGSGGDGANSLRQASDLEAQASTASNAGTKTLTRSKSLPAYPEGLRPFMLTEQAAKVPKPSLFQTIVKSPLTAIRWLGKKVTTYKVNQAAKYLVSTLGSQEEAMKVFEAAQKTSGKKGYLARMFSKAKVNPQGWASSTLQNRKSVFATAPNERTYLQFLKKKPGFKWSKNTPQTSADTTEALAKNTEAVGEAASPSMLSDAASLSKFPKSSKLPTIVEEVTEPVSSATKIGEAQASPKSNWRTSLSQFFMKKKMVPDDGTGAKAAASASNEAAPAVATDAQKVLPDSVGTSASAGAPAPKQVPDLISLR